ncbi:tRNA lysidine(34) synthetase TilS [Aquiflexum sp.]|uniref:tRNA lysidine(34) synthetase TilS n=1 Tax=Aquiflexum sp. TaxID=1872584 RepID=UPI003593A14B
MKDLFKIHIRSKNLLDLEKSYLLAISGGIDSVCLGHMLHELGFRFSLGHVNFQLRGKESDGDETFVRNLAAQWEVPIYVTKTNREIFKTTGKSTQMAARDFRYGWFEELTNENGFDGVLVAHQFEDQIETIFLNLLRGTGIEGIYGMADKRGIIVRPLLPFSRTQIREYMEGNGFSWRNDSSNETNDYKRNLLRNRVLPTLSEDFPDGLQVLDMSFKRLKDTGKAFFELYGLWREQYVRLEDGYQYLEISSIKNLSGRQSMLYYWLRDFGFSYFDVEDVFQSVDIGEPGKTFYAGEYMLNLDREFLILGKNDFEWEPLAVSTYDIELNLRSQKFEILRLWKDFEIERSSENAMLDFAKLKFPLSVRKWEQGDRMVPLGMDKEKKISDLLVDLKVPIIKKKQVLVLLSGDKIAWLVGYRISDHFKCTPSTKQVLYFKKVIS